MWNWNSRVLGREVRQRRSSNVSLSGSEFHYQAFEPKFLLAQLLGEIWSGTDLNAIPRPHFEPLIPLKDVGVFQLNSQPLREALRQAPLEFEPGYQEQKIIISVPRPDATLAQFKVVESPIMESELAAEFPDFKTYRGVGIDNPADTIRFDWTLHGFRAQILSPNGNYYIDPYFKGQTELYSSYFRSSVAREDLAENRKIFGCGCGCGSCPTCGNPSSILERMNEGDGFQPLSTFGNQLRTFRLANAATGEYTQFWGGTVAQGQAAIVTAINRVTGIYEKDLAIRLVLVNNNSNLVFTDPNTDPYSNNNVSSMLSQNQSTVDSIIGNANYDVGHVFGTGPGGVAVFGSVGVTGQKARGVSGLPNPSGDPFHVDYVAHEIGHQFRASHTFNGTGGSCSGNRTATSAFEPGSGTTIMAYAGICGADNVQFNSDPFFHSHSIDQIRAFITTGTAANVGTTTNTGNNIPTVSTPGNFVIPARTPFELTATGSDADGNQTLTYSWEQRNLGPAVSLAAADNGSSPIFRSYTPTTNPTRVFPRLQNLVNNSVPAGEKLPTTNWSSMNFRVVVRDNASGGGGVNFANVALQVVDTGVGFRVTSQNSATTWQGNSTQTITWNVAGTNGSGINASQVDIWLSTDGGFNYTTQLAQAVPNNGSVMVTVPNLSTNQARIKVKATGNVFFDINDVNITINAVTSVLGGFVYYRGSSFASGGVAAAIDTSKDVALETSTPQTLSYANLINTTRGINGLVFEMQNLQANSLAPSDFQFQVSPLGAFNEAANPASGWASAPNPLSISVSSGPVRQVVLQWTDAAISNRWLRVTIRANANTGLQQPQSYYIGHLLGETTGLDGDGVYRVTVADAVQISGSVSPVGVAVTNRLDLNKDGFVTVADIVASTGQIGTARLTNITIGSGSSRPSMLFGPSNGGDPDAGRIFTSRAAWGAERVLPNQTFVKPLYSASTDRDQKMAMSTEEEWVLTGSSPIPRLSDAFEGGKEREFQPLLPALSDKTAKEVAARKVAAKGVDDPVSVRTDQVFSSPRFIEELVILQI
jgi:hypothetical protein